MGGPFIRLFRRFTPIINGWSGNFPPFVLHFGMNVIINVDFCNGSWKKRSCAAPRNSQVRLDFFSETSRKHRLSEQQVILIDFHLVSDLSAQEITILGGKNLVALYSADIPTMLHDIFPEEYIDSQKIAWASGIRVDLRPAASDVEINLVLVRNPNS
jgi:hypothetical protein